MRTWKLVVYPAVIAIAVLFSAACGGSGEKAKPTEGPNPPQGAVEKAKPTATAMVEAKATNTPTPRPTNTPLPPEPTDTLLPPEPTDTPIPPPPSQQQEQPAAPPPAPPLPGPTTYTGTHSGGGTVSFVVSADGRSVESFQAKGFCGFDSEYLGGMSMRITGGSFYWEWPLGGGRYEISGSLDATGHASGYVSYHSPTSSCHRDYLSWSASTQ